MGEERHKYFFAFPKEMPWKRKEREMDNEFKRLVLELLMNITILLLINKPDLTEEERSLVIRVSNKVKEYDKQLG